MVLLGFTLGSLAAIRGLSSDIRKRIVVIGGVTVVIVPRFTFPIALFVLDGYAWAEGLAIWDGEICDTATGLPLANVLADSYLNSLVGE
jgi:hypothetical protein